MIADGKRLEPILRAEIAAVNCALGMIMVAVKGQPTRPYALPLATRTQAELSTLVRAATGSVPVMLRVHRAEILDVLAIDATEEAEETRSAA